MNKLTINEGSACAIRHVNVSNLLTRSHPAKREIAPEIVDANNGIYSRHIRKSVAVVERQYGGRSELAISSSAK